MNRIYRIVFLGHSPSMGNCPPGARASRPHPYFCQRYPSAPMRPSQPCWRLPAAPAPWLVAAELQCESVGSGPVGGHHIRPTEGEQWRRSRLIEVGETGEAVPSFVRAGRPRSRGDRPGHRFSVFDAGLPACEVRRGVLPALAVMPVSSMPWPGGRLEGRR